MSTALRAAIRFAVRTLADGPGVFEFHKSEDDGTLMPIGKRPVGAFFEAWGYALGELDVPPAYLNSGRFIGIVHGDGAYLVEVLHAESTG